MSAKTIKRASGSRSQQAHRVASKTLIKLCGVRMGRRGMKQMMRSRAPHYRRKHRK